MKVNYHNIEYIIIILQSYQNQHGIVQELYSIKYTDNSYPLSNKIECGLCHKFYQPRRNDRKKIMAKFFYIGLAIQDTKENVTGFLFMMSK